MTGARDLALGLDIGGTSTRALVIDCDGRRHGTGRAAGANITSHSPEEALARIRSAVEKAVSTIDPTAVSVAIIGTAGIANLQQPDIAAALERTWTDAGLECGFTVVSDAEVAFAAGTSSPDGTLVLAGTGSFAARIVGNELDHVADAHGWLLGDLGSGFYLGREALRATLRVFDEQGTPGPLARAILVKILGDADVAINRSVVSELVRRVHTRPPVTLAEYAPLVSEFASDDKAAARIINDAAGHLIDAAHLVRSPGDATPIVLAGGLLVADTPVATAVRRALTAVWPTADFGYARDGAAGAAWLAASSLRPLSDSARTTLFT